MSGPLPTQIDFSMSDIGLTAGDTFRYVITYLASNAYRSDEFHGVSSSTVSGNLGWASISLAVGDYNTFNSTAAPEFGSSVIFILPVFFIGMGVIIRKKLK